MFTLKGTHKPVECSTVDAVVTERVETSSLLLMVCVFPVLIILAQKP